MKIAQLLVLSTLLPLAGCLDSGGSGGDSRSTGLVTPNGIGGLSYTTASQQGRTNSDGSFFYLPGEQLRLTVGDLVIAEGVPAREIVTPLDFFPAIRAQLETPAIDDYGLLTHRLVEQQLLNDVTLVNLTRFLLSLNWEGNTREGRGIDIPERVRSQLNAALPYLSQPVDFYVSEEEFTEEGEIFSPANQLLAKICFYPEGDELCEEPPTIEEIEAAPPRPEDDTDLDPDILYQEDLQNKRDRILDAQRRVSEVSNQEVREYLTRELDMITTGIANRYYLDEETASYPASDTSIHSVQIRRIGAQPDLLRLEAISTRPLDIHVHAYDRQAATVEYFVAGETGGESEILINFRPGESYRWVRKSLRVLIR